MKIIIIPIIFLLFISCSSERTDNEKADKEIRIEPKEQIPENHFIGCWEEKMDSIILYWCFDSTEVNRDGYIHPYVFQGDTLQVSTLKYQFTLEGDKCILVNLLDSSKIEMERSALTESPNVF